ncbi:MAG: substrate-binding domain-containing protein [Acidobacteria bacterium]|nr:substrate-binding domain-containing protein [Acidobacteriota bacterium]
MVKKMFCLLLMVGLLFLFGCSSQEKKEKSVVTLSGAFAIYPTAVAWADEFQKIDPNVKIEISAGGAGKGAADCIAGLVDIGMVSRDPDASELEKGIKAIPICHDGVFVIINEKNPFAENILEKGLTKETLNELYINKKKMSFEEILGIKKGNNNPANIYTRSDSCGAAATFAKFLGKFKQENLAGVGVNSDPQMINAVLNDVNGISYVNFSYVFGKDGKTFPGVKVVPIDVDGSGKIEEAEKIASREDAVNAINNGIYPIQRKNYFFVKGDLKGKTKEYIKFCLGETGTKILQQCGTSIPLPDKEREEILNQIK